MIKIQEVLPNPVGVDKGGEYIILVNDGNDSQSLVGWKIRDKSGKEFSLSSYVIEAGEGLKFSDSVSGLILNNDGEVVELLNPAGEVVDRVEYSGQAQEGLVRVQNAQISEEVKDQLFEDLAGPGQSVEQYKGSSYGSLIGLGVVVALVLGLVGVFLITRFQNGKSD